METERPDAIFRDPYARRLSGERGQEIVSQLKRGREMAWTMIVRTAVFDELMLDLVNRRSVDTVINLAAGLDARPWRLPLPPDLRWVDVDLPEMLQYKTETIGGDRPRCHYEAIPTDLTDSAARRALFERLGATTRSALIVTEGLLIYLSEEQVAALARDLHAQPAFRWWLTDMISPALLQWIQKDWGKELERGNAPFRFAPASGSEFFRPYGWREHTFRSTGDESRRLHREIRGAWIWKLLGLFMSRGRREQYRRMSGQLLLERI